jgi:putative endonuclease
LLARNLRLGPLELDIVARDGRVVVVIEVRYRGAGAWTSAFGSIDLTKRRRIRTAGRRLWLQRFKRSPDVDRMRFDVASVTWNGDEPQIEYVKAAL